MKFLVLMVMFMLSTASPASAKTHQHGDDKKEKSFDPENKKAKEGHYTCPMHPQIIRDEKGSCPICGMDLVFAEKSEDFDLSGYDAPKKEQWACSEFPDVILDAPGDCPMDGTPLVKLAAYEPAHKIIAKLMLRKAQMSHFHAAVFPVQPMRMKKSLSLLGRVVINEKREATIPARVGGRVEKLYVNQTGVFVRKGDPVLTLYSPDLITAAKDYLVLRKEGRGNQALIRRMLEQAKRKLSLYGVTRSQIDQWTKRGKVPYQITIYSPVSGIITRKLATEGRYFKEGQNFFEVVDLSEVWVELDVYEHDASSVRLRQHITMTTPSIPGKQWLSAIDFIDPIFDMKNHRLIVRATIANDDGLVKPGMIIDAQVTVQTEKAELVIPHSAVIDTGVRKVVWVEVEPGKYIGKKIRTGFASKGFVAVVHGLQEGEKVVVEGNFLLDAQAQLFGGYSHSKTDRDTDANTGGKTK